jgi:hypothetical protein
MRKDEKREVTPEFVNMSKEILYPQIQGVTPAAGVCRELRLLSRAGVRSAGKPFYAGDSACLRDGTAQPQSQLHLASHYLRGDL